MQHWNNQHFMSTTTITVTMNILLDFLEARGYIVELRPNQNCQFARVKNAIQTHKSPKSDNANAGSTLKRTEPILYLCNDRSANLAATLHLAPLLFLKDQASSDSSDANELFGDTVKQLAIVRSSQDESCLEKLRGDVLDCILSIHEFSEALERASEGSNAHQKLMDVAEAYFGCFMNMTDANYRLLAYTRHIAPQDEINASLVSTGYHTEAFLKRQRFTGYLLDNIAEQTGVKVYPPKPPFPYGLVTSVLHVDDQYAGHVLMACDMGQITPGTVDSFALFASYCEKLARRSSDILPLRDSPSQAFLLRLVAEKNTDRIFLREQAEQLGIPFADTFLLALLKYDPIFRSQLSHLGAHIDKIIETPHVTFLLDKQIGLLLYGSSEKTLWDAVSVAGATHPNNATPHVYLSDAFYKLSGVHCGYRQLVAVQKYETEALLCLSMAERKDRRNILSFRDVFCFYWNDVLADEEIRHFSLSHLLVNKIMKNDEKCGIEDLVLLFIYLTNERKATRVGAMCHLHRNGVLYRMEKLENSYGFDLDDNLTRQYLQTSIRIKLVTSQEFLEQFQTTLDRLLEAR